ncbi:MAG: hypothetical protein K0U84_18690 [Actinomycetia bacterium]|nr:hypothetical protein [Actinomycetes bacterium]
MTATWRPVPWSACSVITAAIASSVAAVIDTRDEALAPVNAEEDAHCPKADSQPSRLVHIDVEGAHTPTRSTQPRSAGRHCAGAIRAEKSRFRHAVRGAARPTRRHDLS